MTTKEQTIADQLFHLINNSPESCWTYPTFFESKEVQENHMIWMVDQIQKGKITGEKAHRWIGFVQGVLVSRGVTSVDQEANRVRGILGKEWLKSLDKEEPAVNEELSKLDPKSYY